MTAEQFKEMLEELIVEAAETVPYHQVKRELEDYVAYLKLYYSGSPMMPKKKDTSIDI